MNASIGGRAGLKMEWQRGICSNYGATSLYNKTKVDIWCQCCTLINHATMLLWPWPNLVWQDHILTVSISGWDRLQFTSGNRVHLKYILTDYFRSDSAALVNFDFDLFIYFTVGRETAHGFKRPRQVSIKPEGKVWGRNMRFQIKMWK